MAIKVLRFQSTVRNFFPFFKRISILVSKRLEIGAVTITSCVWASVCPICNSQTGRDINDFIIVSLCFLQHAPQSNANRPSIHPSKARMLTHILYTYELLKYDCSTIAPCTPTYSGIRFASAYGLPFPVRPGSSSWRLSYPVRF